MAIDLYTKKEEVATWKKILFIFSFALLLIVSSIFTYNQFSKIPENAKSITEVNNLLGKQGTPEQLLEKDLVLGAESKINEFKGLYNQKSNLNLYLDKFETWVYPRVFFSTSTINVENMEVSLKGQTDVLQSVMQQMILLDAQKDILSYNISNIEIKSGEIVTFNLSLKVNSELFKQSEKINLDFFKQSQNE